MVSLASHRKSVIKNYKCLFTRINGPLKLKKSLINEKTFLQNHQTKLGNGQVFWGLALSPQTFPSV